MATVALSWVAAVALLAADAPVLTPEAAAALFAKSPAFAGKTGRVFGKVTRVIPVSDASPRTGWVVEVDLVEGGKTVTGRAVVAAASCPTSCQTLETFP